MPSIAINLKTLAFKKIWERKKKGETERQYLERKIPEWMDRDKNNSRGRS